MKYAKKKWESSNKRLLRQLQRITSLRFNKLDCQESEETMCNISSKIPRL